MKLDQVKAIEEKIESEVFGWQGQCNKCCEVLRRMKGSILTYKGYLENEGEAF